MPEAMAGEEFWSFLLLRMRVAIASCRCGDRANLTLAGQHLVPTQQSFSMGNPIQWHVILVTAWSCMFFRYLQIFPGAGVDMLMT